MREIRYLRITKSDLAWLFHTSELQIDRWIRDGLKPWPDGKFLLSRVLQWRERQHKKQLASAATSRFLTQKQLADLFGVSRQTITAWGRVGLPRQKNNLYDLSDICKWLFIYHHEQAKREYRDRLNAINRKLERNTKQLLKFIRTVNYF